MSMNYYAIEDYGLYLLPEDFSEYAAEHNLDEAELGDIIPDLAAYYDANVEASSCVTGEEIDVDTDFFYVGQLQKFPTLFACAYKNTNEALVELVKNFGKYLPDDFDFEGRFARFSGTTYG